MAAAILLCDRLPRSRSRWRREANRGGGGSRLTMGMRRHNAHKRVLLEQEQEKERRRIEEAIRRLDAIEQQRKRAQERKLDRERRRIAYAELLERSALMLQRCERGRQGRVSVECRCLAAAKLVKCTARWIKKKAIFAAIKRRMILRIATKVEATVDECIQQARATVSDMVVIQSFHKQRVARVIQRTIRTAARRLRSTNIIGRAAARWLARSTLHRARMRTSILRYRGSLSRRARGLPEPEPQALTVLNAVALSKRGGPTRQGRWWDVGPAIVSRPQWINPRVKEEEARSRQRAASLGHLIGAARRSKAVGGGFAGVSKEGPTSKRPSGRLDLDPMTFASQGGGRAEGFEGRRGKRRRASMLDPREAEAAVLEHEARVMEQARREASMNPTDFRKLTVMERHLLRERQFEAEKKWRLTAGKKLQERAKVQRAEERVQQRALEKLQEFRERKARSAMWKEGQRARESAGARRYASEAALERDKERRSEREGRKRRAEEDTRNGADNAVNNTQGKPPGDRRVLAPLAAGNGEKDRKPRKTASMNSTDFKKLIVIKRHLLRERQFEEEQKKRKLTVEKKLQLKERAKAQQAEEKARQRALEAYAARRMEKERERLRFEKLQEFRERKLVKDLADKKAADAKREEEQRAREEVEARRYASEAALERDKERRSEREGRKRRAEEDTRNGADNAVNNTQGKPPGDRRVLAPLAEGNREEGEKPRKEGRLGGREDPVILAAVRRANDRVRDRRRRLNKVPPPEIRVPFLPTVPCRKAVEKGADSEDLKRIRRRSSREPAAAQGAADAAMAVVGGGGDHRPRVLSSMGKGGELERLPPLLKSGVGEAPRGSTGTDGSTGSILTDSGEGDRLFSTRTGLEATASRGSMRCLDHEAAAEAKALTGGGDGKGRRRSGAIAEDEVLTLGTLDSAFPVPGQATESGGNVGLGATSPSNGGRENEGRRRNEPLADDEVLTLETLESAFLVPVPAAESSGDGGLGATSPPKNGVSPGWTNSIITIVVPGTAVAVAGAAGGATRRDPSRGAESESEPPLSSARVCISQDVPRLRTDSTRLLESGRSVSSGDSTDGGASREEGGDESVGDHQADIIATAFDADFSLSTPSHFPSSGSREERGRFENAPGDDKGEKNTAVAAQVRGGIVALDDDASAALDSEGLFPTLTRPRAESASHRSNNESPLVLLPRDFHARETSPGVKGVIHPPRSSSSRRVTPTGLREDVESGDAAATTSGELPRDTPRTLPGSEGTEEAFTLPPISTARDYFVAVR